MEIMTFSKLRKSSNNIDIVVHFANLCNVCLNRRQLDSHICFCVQSIVMSHGTQLLENSSDGMRLQKKNNIFV